ncbi:MAG: hypothetical protein J6W81_02210 [Lentisphaeria bacterium]|nr:hypothetical protein [Lentisphaeria bacterium]
MSSMMRKCLLALIAAGGMLHLSAADAKTAVQVKDPTEAKEAEEKIQKITFMQDDDQTTMVSKIYALKYNRAAELAPFVNSAVLRYNSDSKVTCMNDKANKRQLLIVSTGEDMLPYIDEMVKLLDRPSKMNAFGTGISGTGIAYGTYKPQFRSTESMLDFIDAAISSGSSKSKVRIDEQTGMFYFKDTPAKVASIKECLAWLDKAGPQVSVELKIYEVRDSDLRDIGIDYLAWKNGPGMNLFKTGYDLVNMQVAETLINSAARHGIDLFSNSSYSFGGFYTAPAFDFSFIRILQQNGKAIINSTAGLMLTNVEDKTFKVSFSPEYQNILKDEDHRSSVSVGGDASLEAGISNVVITATKKGIVNFSYAFTGSNVVERNNMGAEISENTVVAASASLEFGKEKILTSWKRTSKVEQTIGIPVLCEIPILKYLFGTTTTNIETVYYVVTARALPIRYNDDMKPGIMTEFKELVSK